VTDTTDPEALYEHLAATAELPIERRASRLLGEAEAVADDLRDCSPDVQTQRAAVVLELLEEIEETGNPEADEHLECARTLAADLADDSDGS
jgi:hypothetical protein